MIIGIVGAEECKFTPYGKAQALTLIRRIVSHPQVTGVVSGGCHLGGVDIWAKQVAEQYGRDFREFLPAEQSWHYGYRIRNLQIASHSDVLHCITVPYLPDTYTGKRFLYCYHCDSTTHVKSGGCWTLKEAARMRKVTALHIVKQAITDKEIRI
jgi:hypothetical protein